jgi:hypothetical protein
MMQVAKDRAYPLDTAYERGSLMAAAPRGASPHVSNRVARSRSPHRSGTVDDPPVCVFAPRRLTIINDDTVLAMI